ncbi:hypothetical protein Pen02_68040 [Plantactinospora endophytica]|uniref:DUF2795 domain-containing protein n=1 Tax=Plantactinospora endophytica TaxID=673535 RepID=A0ABQ4EAW3_9ACTN|nr:hypothetical protein [Plantactinospora endophytica]GIG91868.1 hypothetical protein Pen02_68040 [Plantactinospora endophytica]
MTDQPARDVSASPELDALLDDLYHGQERVTQSEIQRRAVAAEVPAELLTRITALPQGEYAVDEVAELLGGTPG